MSARASTLYFGNRKLSNLWCEKCQAETLHVFNTCNHCKTERVVQTTREPPSWNGNPLNGPKPKP